MGRRERDGDLTPGGRGLVGQGHSPSGDRGVCRTDDLAHADQGTPEGR